MRWRRWILSRSGSELSRRPARIGWADRAPGVDVGGEPSAQHLRADHKVGVRSGRDRYGYGVGRQGGLGHGDGSDPIACGAGTPYADGYGKSDSPTCGYRYQRTSADQPSGAYEVAATSFWRVEWAGGGMTGVIEFDLSATADIRVGEAQVLTQ